MKVIVTESFAESCQLVAQEIIDVVNQNPAAKLGLATGGTAEQVYPHLVKAYQDGKVDFSGISTVNLDEYMGMSPEHPVSYRKCMDTWFFDQVNVDKSRTYVANGLNDPEAEIAAFNEKLYGDKMLDFQLLGVGVSGHIGFNEAGEYLTAGVHIEQLDESTIQANSRYFDSPDDVPRQSITMGVGDIMKAEKIVLIATGDSKVPVMKRLLADDRVSADLPVSVLKLHRDATIVIDRELYEKATR
ncbi:MAG: glucosamine-6-phosphate deaminase [Ruminococcaceae bacterium]|nr:glucosamine-6-phosphate deaminase [Oscillospiraceae bacterium]